MANTEINDTIKDFVNFDIEKNYYQKEDKEELVRQFKQIVYEDETSVRQFLKSMFQSAKKLAAEYSLIVSDGETEEIPVEIEEPIEGEIDIEEPEDASEVEEEPISTEESNQSFMSRVASNILYE
jgi:hypothetical protein